MRDIALNRFRPWCSFPDNRTPCSRRGNAMSSTNPRQRAQEFCRRYGLQLPILEAPMAGAAPASLAIAVAQAGGMGALGALMLKPDAVKEWAREVRAQSNGAFQLNMWIPEPAPLVRNADAEAR